MDVYDKSDRRSREDGGTDELSRSKSAYKKAMQS